MSKDSRYYLNILEDGKDREFNFYSFNSFTNQILIGTGGFGNVYRANYKDANMLVALKSYEASSNLKEIVNEVRIQKAVDIHDNILRFLGVTKQEQEEICFSGIREKVVEGTPIRYWEIYQECWQNDPDIRPTMSQIFDKLKKINLNSPVFQITSSNNSVVSLHYADSMDIELCIKDFFTNIIEQNHDISLQYEVDFFNSQAKDLWNILVKLTNIGKEFTQISKEINEHYMHRPRIIKSIFEWLKHYNENMNPDSNSNLQCLLGFFHFMGISTRKDQELAFNLFNGAAINNPIAVFYLAECFRCGYGVNKDPAKAIE
ncbi:4338_t:CDS:2, partial [Racocetra persica]